MNNKKTREIYSKELKKYNKKEDIKNWLEDMNIRYYVINDDLTVDVNGNVNISYKYLINIPIPIQFGIVTGYFYCDYNELITLEGCPIEVKKRFTCSKNRLTIFNIFT